MRGFQIAIWEQWDYYHPGLISTSTRAGSAILFWVPFAFGTLSYTLTSFNWASLVTALENNLFLKFVRLPLVIFFYLLIPVFLAVAAASGYLIIPYAYVFTALLGVAGVFETIAFFYLGIKVLLVLRMISDQLRKSKTAQEIKVSTISWFSFLFPFLLVCLCSYRLCLFAFFSHQLTFFVIGAVLLWLSTLIMLGINAEFALVLTNNPSGSYATAIARDILMILLGIILLVPRIPSKSPSTKISSPGREKSQEKLGLARTHSALNDPDRGLDKEKEMEEV